ncbi:two-component system response regulator BaeR/two-component system response regulator MtrA/two-component system response regulator VanR [Ruminococcaceae bacterium R-25]|nr:two-component system response regulator BaeR/two-component system response regulator MtrA/two-component system response regulator VanR [Ruminococcaceae bacterium R-25]SUQ21762.1 Response regulator receiver domain-containing protein [Oscillospiraceae bacterium]
MSFRLLIVEDSPELLEAASDFFREEGAGLWNIVTASDGNDALAKVNSESFDLMILDIMLPGASGFDICKAARKISDCPIILYRNGIYYAFHILLSTDHCPVNCVVQF